MKLSYLNVSTTSPSWNLALEQYVFDCLPRDRTYFMLWQNDNAIIVGKYQNTLAEIDLPYVREHNIQVVRRLSGGGAVYHDLGNLNFTFISDAGREDQINFHLFCRPVLQALEELGVKAEINGRNDLTIDGKKFSGNSQYIRQGRVMHHGTILFDSDLSVVERALQVDPEKIRGKGIRSVHSRVTNVKDHLPRAVELSEFRRVLLAHILRRMPGEEYILSPAEEEAVAVLERERYQTWEWNYGSSPAVTLIKRERVEGCGLVEVSLFLDRGRIQEVSFHGDFFSAEEPEQLAKRLVGRRLEPESCRAALEGADVSRYFKGMTWEDLLRILTG